MSDPREPGFDLETDYLVLADGPEARRELNCQVQIVARK